MSRLKHGHTAGAAKTRKFTSEYTTWGQMIQRCHNQNAQAYPKYGGIGITVCQRWRDSFEAFLEDMGPKPSLKHTIDRFPDRAGNYEPGNARWATRTEQARNVSRNVILTLEGESRTLPEWAELRGLAPDLVKYRLRVLGWSVDRALGTPSIAGQKTQKINRRKLTVEEIRSLRSDLANGIPRAEIAYRLGVTLAVVHAIAQGKNYSNVR